jgi:Na+-transporting methylmalonyl-CoA/oxaloacetate decarboxylase gamma subunit
MQRVRIGLTGLALVFVLVLLGAVIRSAGENEPAAANVADQAAAPDSAANAQQAGSTDPLAELGVAPGNADLPNAGTESPRN